MVTANGGMNQQRVAVSNTTPLTPTIMLTSFLSQFMVLRLIFRMGYASKSYVGFEDNLPKDYSVWNRFAMLLLLLIC